MFSGFRRQMFSTFPPSPTTFTESITGNQVVGSIMGSTGHLLPWHKSINASFRRSFIFSVQLKVIIFLLYAATSPSNSFVLAPHFRILRQAQQSSVYISQIYQHDISLADKYLHEDEKNIGPIEYIIHWRGEKSFGNSLQLRHLEFRSALGAIIDTDTDTFENTIPEPVKEGYGCVSFTNSLKCDFQSDDMQDYHVEAYEGAMQYLHWNKDDQVSFPQTNGDFESSTADQPSYNSELVIRTVRRSSLVRAAYQIVGEGDSYQDLARSSLDKGILNDLFKGGMNENDTWRVRLRQYGSNSKEGKEKQYGKQMRSPMSAEKEALNGLKDLLIKLGGDVDLKKAHCSLYIFEGLKGRQKVLARQIARGPKTSSIAPVTRICVTNTPLCPIAAFNMCNLARIKDGQKILDPFAGSCATLLASAMIAPNCQTVGIEVAHNGQVNREDVLSDFGSRNLTLPVSLIHGDCTLKSIRDEARAAIGNEPYDIILTDPPYGIREKTGYCEDTPLSELMKCIAKDKEDGSPLLKKGGRLVAFVPNTVDTNVMEDGIPSDKVLEQAGLELCEMREQYLNDFLSRWLVEFKCIDDGT